MNAQLAVIKASTSSKTLLDGFEILLKLLQNILMHPSEDKYRQIKGTNAKIKATLFAINGASNLLTIMNFTEIEP